MRVYPQRILSLVSSPKVQLSHGDPLLNLECKLRGFVSLTGFISCNEDLFAGKDKNGVVNKDTPIFHDRG